MTPLFALTLITFFEVTESAGVVKPADFFSYADDAADAFDGEHK